MNQAPDDLKVKNEETYEELISLIENTQGRLAPIVIACDDLALQRRIIERYEAEARQSKIRPYRIMLGQEPSIRAGLAALKQSEAYLQTDGAAVFTVMGAEMLLRVKLNPHDEQSNLDKFFGYLQWTREGLREFRYPIAIWVSYRILKEMSRRAPDFWSWRKAVLRFVTESEPALANASPAPMTQQLEAAFDDEFLPPIAELQAEIAQSAARDPQSLGLATLYQRLGQVYARRVNRRGAENPEAEREKAIDAFRQAIGIYRQVGDRLGEANCLKAIGDVLQFLRRSTEALENYEAAIGIYRQVGNRLGEANCLKAIGDVLQFLDRYTEALENYEAAIGIYRQVGERLGEANCLVEIGDLQADSQQGLEQFLLPALEIYQQIGDVYSQGRIQADSIAPIYLKLQQPDQAKLSYKQALAFWSQIGYEPGIRQCQNALQTFD